MMEDLFLVLCGSGVSVVPGLHEMISRDPSVVWCVCACVCVRVRVRVHVRVRVSRAPLRSLHSPFVVKGFILKCFENLTGGFSLA